MHGKACVTSTTATLKAASTMIGKSFGPIGFSVIELFSPDCVNVYGAAREGHAMTIERVDYVGPKGNAVLSQSSLCYRCESRIVVAIIVIVWR